MRRFTVHAPSAQTVQLQLIAPVVAVVPMHRNGRGMWSVDVPDIAPGQRYGFRCSGPSHNPAKLLLDPRARAIAGNLDWHPSTALDHAADSAHSVPHSVVVPDVVDPHWDRPRHARDALVVYEAHVKGMTRTHPDVPKALRGTYAGLAHPAVVGHLHDLGVTAIELLPVHAHISEPHLMPSGRVNYWGYSTIGFFAPHNAYTACQRPQDGPEEFRNMVRALHAAGIEVWLDVVFNHTGEGGTGGPTLCWRGLGEADWYRTHRGKLIDYTGCGNTLDVRKDHVQDLIVDSLVYWTEQMGIDGFRFDLAVSLARQSPQFDPQHPLLMRIAEEPALAHTRLVAEPWDLGPQGYAVGRFPAPWMEWNGQFRDVVRDLWRGQSVRHEHVAERLLGSADLTTATGRPPCTSVNFVTCHDGFTMADLVAYEHKHNHANGEDNRDGSTDNRSFNGGIEGPTDAPSVLCNRRHRQRAMLLTLLVSHGTPMLLGGDELGRTQRGNNNAYCQDNALSWFDWDGADADLAAFVRKAIALRRELPALRGGAEHAERIGDRNGPLALHLLPETHDAVVLIVHAGEAPADVRLPVGDWALAFASRDGATVRSGEVCMPSLCVAVLTAQ